MCIVEIRRAKEVSVAYRPNEKIEKSVHVVRIRSKRLVNKTSLNLNNLTTFKKDLNTIGIVNDCLQKLFDMKF